jgi:hypothetical protein
MSGQVAAGRTAVILRSDLHEYQPYDRPGSYTSSYLERTAEVASGARTAAVRVAAARAAAARSTS